MWVPGASVLSALSHGTMLVEAVTNLTSQVGAQGAEVELPG